MVHCSTEAMDLLKFNRTLGRLIWNIVTLLLHCYIFPSLTSKNGFSSNLTSIFHHISGIELKLSMASRETPVLLHGASEPLTKRRSEKSASFALPLVHLWVNSECSFVIYYICVICVLLLQLYNYISHLHFKQKIKVTTSFIWLRIRMDTKKTLENS